MLAKKKNVVNYFFQGQWVIGSLSFYKNLQRNDIDKVGFVR